PTTERTLVERWNGTSWSIVASPNPAGADLAQLLAVTCPTASNCNAVGLVFSFSAGITPLAEHWNGTSWKVVPSDSPPGAFLAELIDVSCASPTNCTAVGGYVADTPDALVTKTLIEHWNGSRWTTVAA